VFKKAQIPKKLTFYTQYPTHTNARTRTHAHTHTHTRPNCAVNIGNTGSRIRLERLHAEVSSWENAY